MAGSPIERLCISAVPGIIRENPPVRSHGVFMRFGFSGLVASVFLALASLAVVAPASAAIVITVDKSAQRMSVVVDGVQKYYWPVSTGSRSYVTPTGTYTAFRLEKEHYSEEWDDAPMPHSIFFTHQGHAIHGSNSRLGVPLSHGCVRLSPQNAATLFNLVERRGVYSTRVVITERAPVVTAKSGPPTRTGTGK
jgi:lipoprotein-anchoring transpeptidase ErfK/SrfK